MFERLRPRRSRSQLILPVDENRALQSSPEQMVYDTTTGHVYYLLTRVKSYSRR